MNSDIPGGKEWNKVLFDLDLIYFLYIIFGMKVTCLTMASHYKRQRYTQTQELGNVYINRAYSCN